MKRKHVNSGKLAVIKTIHTAIYVIMVVSIFYILYAGLTRTFNTWLYIALTLLTIESMVFVGSGLRCPMTNLAKKYGDSKGYVGDMFFPEKYTKYTFRLFGALFGLGLLILLLDVLL